MHVHTREHLQGAPARYRTRCTDWKHEVALFVMDVER
jgi:hypothetical protein